MSPRIKPVLRSRRWKKGDMQGITTKELEAMLKASKNDSHADRNRLMLKLGFEFGLRVSELLELRVRDIDLENAQIHLERSKHGKVHDPAILNALLRDLKSYLKKRNGKPNDYLFVSQWNSEKPISRVYFFKWFQKTAQAAGLPIAKQHPHALRHGLGFLLSANGCNAQTIGQALGHRDGRMALMFYGSVTDEVADDARKDALRHCSYL